MTEIRHPLAGQDLEEYINPMTGKPLMIERHDSSREYRSPALVPKDTFNTVEGTEKPNPPRFHEARTIPPC